MKREQQVAHGHRGRSLDKSKRYFRSEAFTLPIGAPAPTKPTSKRGSSGDRKRGTQFELLPAKPALDMAERERQRQMKESEHYFRSQGFRSHHPVPGDVERERRRQELESEHYFRSSGFHDILGR